MGPNAIAHTRVFARRVHGLVGLMLIGMSKSVLPKNSEYDGKGRGGSYSGLREANERAILYAPCYIESEAKSHRCQCGKKEWVGRSSKPENELSDPISHRRYLQRGKQEKTDRSAACSNIQGVCSDPDDAEQQCERECVDGHHACRLQPQRPRTYPLNVSSNRSHVFVAQRQR